MAVCDVMVVARAVLWLLAVVVVWLEVQGPLEPLVWSVVKVRKPVQAPSEY